MQKNKLYCNCYCTNGTDYSLGIFGPISIGFQDEHTRSDFKFRGICVGQFPAGFCFLYLKVLHKPLRGKKEWQTDCSTHSDMEQLFNIIILLWVHKKKGQDKILLMETIFYSQILKESRGRQKTQQFAQKGAKKGSTAKLTPAQVSGSEAACCRVVSLADVEAAVLARAEALTWTQLWVADVALQVLSCTSSLGENPSAASLLQDTPTLPGGSQSIS